MSGSITWQKSSFSGGGDGNNCIELTAFGDATRLRESNDPGVVVTIAPESLGELIRRLKDGAFDRLG